MSSNCKNFIAGAVLLACIFGVTDTARAQNSGSSEKTIPERFDSAFYGLSGTFGWRTSLWGQVLERFVLYPDREMVGAGNRVEDLYREMMQQQSMSDPVIRTPDLENPFGSSLLLSPPSR